MKQKDCVIYRYVKPFGISHRRIEQSIHFICTYLRIRSYSVRVHFVGTMRMQTLNRTYRGVDRPTDVLSFPLQEDSGFFSQETEDLGDIFLCPLYVIAQAKRYGVSFEQEFFRMVVHGMLHLLGYDHQKKKDAEQMFFVQEQLLTRILSL